MSQVFVTKRYIEDYLTNKPSEQAKQFLGRALVVLFNNQTEAEKQINTTNQDNGIGFTGADAHSGCITAKTFLKRGTLLDWQFERWTRRNKRGSMRISKYWRQLDDAAKAKAAKAQKAAPVATQPAPAAPAPKPRSWADVKTAVGVKTPDPTLDADWIEAKNAFAAEERAMEAKAYMAEEGLEYDPVLAKLEQWQAEGQAS
jgi:hypothetical protein